jgi:hypothetical protein
MTKTTRSSAKADRSQPASSERGNAASAAGQKRSPHREYRAEPEPSGNPLVSTASNERSSTADSELEPPHLLTDQVGRARQHSVRADKPDLASAGTADVDLLAMTPIAEHMTQMIVASLGASPFVVSIDAEWGRGKSWLLLKLNDLLDANRILTVNFNAWTTDSDDVLEGLVKAILKKLREVDTDILRRIRSWLFRNKFTLALARLFTVLTASFWSMSEPVDYIWKALSEYEARDKLPEAIATILQEWREAGDSKSEPRLRRQAEREYSREAVVVLIDDLDRCSDEVIVRLCEAVKLYLAAKGLIFVIACHQTALERGVSSAVSNPALYLQKIVQATYQLPRPSDESMSGMLRKSIADARADYLLPDIVIGPLAGLTDGNPRRAKRIVNRCIIQDFAEKGRTTKHVTDRLLVLAVVLEEIDPAFLDWLVSKFDDGVREHETGDPYQDKLIRFLEYARLKIQVDQIDKRETGDYIWIDGHVGTREAAENRAHGIGRRLPDHERSLYENRNFVDFIRYATARHPAAFKANDYPLPASYDPATPPADAEPDNFKTVTGRYSTSPASVMRRDLHSRPLTRIGAERDADRDPPAMRSIVPSSVHRQQTVTVYGSNFGHGSSDSAILIDGAVVPLDDLKEWQPNRIRFGIGERPPGGRKWRGQSPYTVTIIVDGTPAGEGLKLWVRGELVPTQVVDGRVSRRR